MAFRNENDHAYVFCIICRYPISFLHSMTALDQTLHTIRCKACSPHYIPTNLARFQSELHEPTIELLDVSLCHFIWSHSLIETLQNISSKSPLECLGFFRQLMVDVIVSSAYGYCLGAVSKWAMNAEDLLSTASNDFPKCGILVSIPSIASSIAKVQRSAVPTWAWDLIRTSMRSLKKVKLPPPVVSYSYVLIRFEGIQCCSQPWACRPLEGFLVMGFVLPPGTIVGTQAWSMHRDASVFPSPETFLPDHWLDVGPASKEQLSRMNQYMMSPQMCRPSNAWVYHINITIEHNCTRIVAQCTTVFYYMVWYVS